MHSPKTLQQAIQYFTSSENCQRFLIELRWPDRKARCPYCGSKEVTYLASARLWKCYGDHPRQKFSLKVGTIFEDSALGLDKWLVAMWLIVNARNGISSCEIARSLGITQKSAWHMAHRIRRALHYGFAGKLGGEVEVDETYIGGKARNMHLRKRRQKITSPGPKDKVPVMGIVRRGGEVRTFVVNEPSKEELQGRVRDHVEAGAAIFTDDAGGYRGLDADFAHEVIDHAVEYVRGNVHTNTMENFWSLLKRGLHGTYVSVEPFHLFRYLDEQAYRYNHRKDETDRPLSDFERFRLACSKIVGKRLTWDEVTGKQPDERPTFPN